jgi:glycosyltransferase involved in cell wall biosynthesis
MIKTMRVAVLVDLPREAAAGGHVKYWERIAQAAVRENASVDLTVYFSGTGADEVLSSRVRFRFLPPVFSTAKLKFLPYVPAHTDLASFHPKLAAELPNFDVIHTTDGFFAFARTAERVTRWHKIPLATSFHTDTPAYAELFTRATLENLFGVRVGAWLERFLKIPQHVRASKEKRLAQHLRACTAVMGMRPEDIEFAWQAGASEKMRPMHLGVDKELFAPERHDRNGIERAYNIAPDQFLVLFVGRVDGGKNMPVLMWACSEAAAAGAELHLIVAGVGPLSSEVAAKLGNRVSLLGVVEPTQLARLYASVDCLAITSDIEIGGMIGIEALASGCPVLVSRKSGVAQLCGDTPAMQKVDSGVANWTAALVRAARDGASISVMRDAAFMFRRDSLTGWNDVLNRDFLPVWHQLAEGRG